LNGAVWGHTLPRVCPVQTVINTTRIALALLAAFAGVGARLCAQGAAAPAANTGLTPSASALLAMPSRWSAVASLEAAYGFKDNLLLSSTAEERSAFARGVAEAFWLYVPPGPLNYSVYTHAQGTQFFSGRSVNDESSVWVRSEVGWTIAGAWKFSLPVTGLFDHRVSDVSDTEVERLVAEQKVAGIIAGPTLRWTIRPELWIEAQAGGERKSYEDGVNDGRVGTTEARMGWVVSERAEVQILGTRNWRSFDSRAQYSASGRELFGTALKIAEAEGRLRLDFKWDRKGNWRTNSEIGLRNYRDNGSGYFSLREKKAEQEIEWKNDHWLVRLRGAARRLNFSVQTVGISINPPPRIKDEYEVGLNVERKLSDRWTFLGSYAWERARSNDKVASYVVNEGLLGVRWSWER
jgi:hypothetical protein